jgi:hypothetical protein
LHVQDGLQCKADMIQVPSSECSVLSGSKDR